MATQRMLHRLAVVNYSPSFNMLPEVERQGLSTRMLEAEDLSVLSEVDQALITEYCWEVANGEAAADLPNQADWGFPAFIDAVEDNPDPWFEQRALDTILRGYGEWPAEVLDHIATEAEAYAAANGGGADDESWVGV